jgi:hypothetical protein
MSQVQPPRTRHSRHRPETIQLLRSAIINVGTLIVTALLLRGAIMIAAPRTTQRGLNLIKKATHVMVWPLSRLTPLQHTLHGGLTVADVSTFVIVLACWLLTLGIVAGWEHEGQRQSVGPSQTGLRP